MGLGRAVSAAAALCLVAYAAYRNLNFYAPREVAAIKAHTGKAKDDQKIARNKLRVHVEECDTITCAKKHDILEPAWANLSFQPRVDWHNGGIRGDCVISEFLYTNHKYCHRGRRVGTKPGPGQPTEADAWPSLERLAAIDVHTNQMPQGNVRDLAEVMDKRTLLIMGDSVMEQFYGVLQCGVRYEQIGKQGRHISPEFQAFLENNRPLWKLGTRKMAPKDPIEGLNGMRILYERVTTMQPDEVDASMMTADVIVFNWGLHYADLEKYSDDLVFAFEKLEKHASQKGKVVLFVETAAQHFKSDDRSGYKSTGEFEDRDKSLDQCACSATEDYNVNRRNKVLHDVIQSGRFPNVHVLPFYNLTRPRWRWHFGNCTHRPTGWKFETCCDCTHFCHSPTFWGAHMYNLITRIRDADRLKSMSAE